MIRNATPADVLGALGADGDFGSITAELTDKIAPGVAKTENCLIHINSNGDIDGFVITSVESFYGRDFIRLLAVSSSHRRLGIGSTLLNTALTKATSEIVFTSTNESNLPMRALLEREGWILSGILTGLDEGDPELVFRRQRLSTSS